MDKQTKDDILDRIITHVDNPSVLPRRKDIRFLLTILQEKIDVIEKLKKSIDDPQWRLIWELMNAFASGKTQKQWSRVEPLAVLGDIYQQMAIIYTDQQKLLKELG